MPQTNKGWEYRWRETGDAVSDLQEALVERGYELPKYGVDGFLGGETWDAVEDFAGVEQFVTSKALPIDVTNRILDVPSKTDKPLSYVRVQGLQQRIKGWRRWEDIDTIVLHQAGIWMSDTPERFSRIKAHFGVLRSHATPIVQAHEINAYLWHANKANRFSVGIEINGHFPGLVKNFNPNRHSSEGPPRAQVEATRETVQLIMREVQNHGGRIQHIIPHRCSNGSKPSDPGEVVWREVGIWAQAALGLDDFGSYWTIGDGLLIPFEWDPRHTSRYYV